MAAAANRAVTVEALAEGRQAGVAAAANRAVTAAEGGQARRAAGCQ